MIYNKKQLMAFLREHGLPSGYRIVDRNINSGMPVIWREGLTTPRFDPDKVLAWLNRERVPISTPASRRRSRTNPATVKRIKLEMKAYRCEACGWGAPPELIHSIFTNKTAAIEMHHIKPVREGGADVPDNLIALCPQCHWIADKFPGLPRYVLVAKIRDIQKLFVESMWP